MSKHTHQPRSKAAILADIQAIEKPVEGTLSTVKRTLKNGEQHVYHILQQTKNGKHTSRYLQPGQVEDVKKGVENRKRLETLMREWLATETIGVLAQDSQPRENPAAEAKKKQTTSSPRSPRRPARPSPPPSRRCSKTASTAR